MPSIVIVCHRCGHKNRVLGVPREGREYLCGRCEVVLRLDESRGGRVRRAILAGYAGTFLLALFLSGLERGLRPSEVSLSHQAGAVSIFLGVMPFSVFGVLCALERLRLSGPVDQLWFNPEELTRRDRWAIALWSLVAASPAACLTRLIWGHWLWAGAVPAMAGCFLIPGAVAWAIMTAR